MLQSPYFFFDVVYLHNGAEEQGDETSWRVSEYADEGTINLCCYLEKDRKITSTFFFFWLLF